jgi:hypothetical protein
LLDQLLARLAGVDGGAELLQRDGQRAALDAGEEPAELVGAHRPEAGARSSIPIMMFPLQSSRSRWRGFVVEQRHDSGDQRQRAEQPQKCADDDAQASTSELLKPRTSVLWLVIWRSQSPTCGNPFCVIQCMVRLRMKPTEAPAHEYGIGEPIDEWHSCPPAEPARGRTEFERSRVSGRNDVPAH